MTVYCPVCSLVVAPRDPARIAVGSIVLHKHCLIRHQLRQNRPVHQTSQIPPVRKTRFPFFRRR